MGLLDKELYSKNTFFFSFRGDIMVEDKEGTYIHGKYKYNSDYFDYPIQRYEYERYGFIREVLPKANNYSLNVLINMDLRYFKGNKYISGLLYDFGLLNRYDRNTLKELNFKEEDFGKTIYDLSLTKTTRVLLNNIGCNYLWQILTCTKTDLATIINRKHFYPLIKKAIEECGYEFPWDRCVQKDSLTDSELKKLNSAKVVFRSIKKQTRLMTNQLNKIKEDNR